MQGLRDLSFLSTKKKPAPADEDGRIKPAFSDVSMYSFMAWNRIQPALWDGGSRNQSMSVHMVGVGEGTWLWSRQKLLEVNGNRRALSSGPGIRSLWRN